MAAMCYNCPISTIPSNEQLLGEKSTYAKFEIDISKTERQVRVYIDEQSDGHG